MRLPINLASEPFRRDRSMVVASAAVGVLLFGLLVMLVVLSASERSRAAESRDAIARVQKQKQVMAQEQARLEAVLRQPQNAQVLEQSVFINQLLGRKGVSWTKIFSDLEQVMPADVRLIQVRPQVGGQNQLVLEMILAAQATEPVIGFLMKLEGSPQFGATNLQASLPPTQNEPLNRYRVTVNYAQTL
ncbi:MAG TPA: hypothetical protein VEQ63_07050 [Bryobacteraceae bacterium]|nr:hypothetical protein [Bryobacteraceae bacterium]